jgi:hypothetical protein
MYWHMPSIKITLKARLSSQKKIKYAEKETDTEEYIGR